MSTFDLLAFIKGADVAGDQWRIVRPFARLRQAGITARWQDKDDHTLPATDPEATVLIVRMVTGTDRATIDRWFAERRPYVKAIIFELDDLMWGKGLTEHLDEAAVMQGKPKAEILADGEMTRYFISRCDGVITSAEPLSALIRAFADCPVVTVPNALDVRWFRSAMASPPPWQRPDIRRDQLLDPVTIGWSGGRRPERDLEPMAEAWGRIARRYPFVQFVTAASPVPDVIYHHVEDDSRIVRLPWLDWEDYPTAYQVSIGCCAVADTPFSRCKTPIKAWEYAVAGAAVVGSRQLYGGELVYGGYEANTADEWDDALSELIESPQRRSMAHHGLLAHVERHHNLDTQLHRWTDAIEAILSASRREVAA